jgi:hypothetical protein
MKYYWEVLLSIRSRCRHDGIINVIWSFPSSLKKISHFISKFVSVTTKMYVGHGVRQITYSRPRHEMEVSTWQSKLFPVPTEPVVPGLLSGYSDRLRAGQPGFHSREGQEAFLYSTASRPALGPSQPPLQWVMGYKDFLPTHKAAGAWSWPLTSI